VDGGCQDELGNGGFVYMNGFIDLKLCGIGRNDMVVARVNGKLKCNAGSDHVFSNWHDESQMAMPAISMGGWNGMCIGIYLLGW